MIVYTQQNETIDQVCWRVYGKTAGIVESVYQLNPQLCELPVILPYGTKLDLPDVVPQIQQAKRIKLWD